MSSSYYACWGSIVEESFVGEICPVELKKLKEVLEKDDQTIEEFASEVQYKEDLTEEHESLWDELADSFKEKTGLSLHVGFFNAEGRGDEVDGVYWEVSEVYEYTPAGKKYAGKITEKSWCDFG